MAEETEETAPLVDAIHPNQYTQSKSFIAHCTTNPLASLFINLHERFPNLCSLRTLLGLIVFLLIILNFGRRRPVYLKHPGPPVPAAQPVYAESGPRGLSARFLTLNIFIRPVLVGVNDYKDQRLVRLLGALKHYDLICLQELFWATGPRKAEFLETLASENGLYYQASAPAPGIPGLLHLPPKLIDAGLVVASKYPIVRTDYHTFSRAIYRSIDFLVAKGVLYARVSLFADLPQRYAHVFTMHLQANNGLENVPFDKVRHTQLEEIANFVQRMTEDDKNGVIILAGDFNIDGRKGYNDSSSSEEYTQARITLQNIRPPLSFQDLLYDANNGTHPITTAGGIKETHQKKERLDYIFLSSGSADSAPLIAGALGGSVRVNQFRVAEASSDAVFETLSDHYGVEAEIFLSEPEPEPESETSGTRKVDNTRPNQ